MLVRMGRWFVPAAVLRGHRAAGQAGLSLQEAKATLASSLKNQSLALGKHFCPVMEVRGHLDGLFCRACSGAEAHPLLGQLLPVPVAFPRWDVEKWASQSHFVRAQTPVLEQGLCEHKECADLEVEHLEKLFLFHPLLCF